MAIELLLQLCLQILPLLRMLVVILLVASTKQKYSQNSGPPEGWWAPALHGAGKVGTTHEENLCLKLDYTEGAGSEPFAGTGGCTPKGGQALVEHFYVLRWGLGTQWQCGTGLWYTLCGMGACSLL